MARNDSAKPAPENEDDLDVVAPLVMDYFNWLSGRGGRSVQEILNQVTLTSNQRRLFLDRCDDVLVIWGVTAPIREAKRKRPPPGRRHR